jgi:AcrR family transcriptional regulator
MLDGTHPKHRLIAQAMELAKTRPWREITLAEIATQAGIPLVDARKEFQAKAQILAAFSHAVDLAVLEKFPTLSQDAPRDRLFDVLITRFEVMQPYKQALKSIAGELGLDLGAALGHVRPAMKSIYWMLQAAGINGEGGMGLMRVKGVMAVYARVFPVWLDDDDAGLAKTMAALDRHLRRGESVIRRAENLKSGLTRVCQAITGKRSQVEEPIVTDISSRGSASEEPSPAI